MPDMYDKLGEMLNDVLESGKIPQNDKNDQITSDEKKEESGHFSFKNDENKAKKAGKPSTGIGKNCKIANTIIDKNARIGDNCKIGVSGKKYEDGDHGSFYSADGIIVIRKGAVISSGTEI